MDVTTADFIAELDETLHAKGIELCFAELKDPVKDKLKRFGLFTQLGESCFFPTIGAASFLDIYDVECDDWEDESQGLRQSRADQLQLLALSVRNR